MRICAVLLLVALPLMAKSDVAVQAWSRATPPGASSAAIYGLFENNSSHEMRVAEIRFTGARHAMIHRTVEDEGMARMVHGEILVPPGERYELKPGGLHIMLMGVSFPLLQGCLYKFQILWENGDSTNHEFVTGGYGQMVFPADAESVGGHPVARLCP
ncbi:MAG: copper chaperone PCu(A)C [bacterium]|jgi:copper(I)-binding protein|nr:copper chaperone PCu(A)C [Gammaproteobacteria bacterium]HIL85959.1 copper chaperone PCu(A)C [Pseudomonadales bacterium]